MDVKWIYIYIVYTCPWGLSDSCGTVAHHILRMQKKRNLFTRQWGVVKVLREIRVSNTGETRNDFATSYLTYLLSFLFSS